MDLPSLNALLRVNGLTSESAPENIADVLLRSGFTTDEVPEAMAILKGTPLAAASASKTPSAYVGRIIEETRAVPRVETEMASIFAGRIGVRQFWMATLLSIAVYGLIFIVIEVSAVPVFSIVSGISLFALPDLSTVPVRSLLLVGVGGAMLIVPALFFLAVMAGLQVRRCHDFGLEGPAWFMAIMALLVGAYLVYRLTPLAALAPAAAVLIWASFMSWPGAKGVNLHGSSAPYSSIWGALYGSYSERRCLNAFAKRFLLPLLYVQLFGIMFGICIHSVIPRAHLPNV